MDIEIPDWLTADFVKSALKDQTNNDVITIADLSVERGVPKGNNYMSDIFRVKVNYYKNHEEDDVTENSLMVKCPITGGLWERMSKFGLIEKEVLMYQEYIPKLSEILNKNDQLTPRSFPAKIKNIIVLEDLNFQGYKMANRLEQLDFKHCAVALKALGKFHAASVKLHEENPEFIERIGKELFFDKDLKADNEFLGTAQMDLTLFELSNWPELNGYMEPINQVRDIIWDLLVDVFKRDNRINVLNHGDCWITNMLFKYDCNNQPTAIRFIDLQISRFGSPAIDLIYFLQGSVQENIRIEKQDELLNIYLKSLNENLLRFKCTTDILTMTELKCMIKKCEFYEFYANITLVPVVINDRKEVFEIKEMSEKDFTDHANNPFRKYLENARFRKLFTKRLVNEFSKHKWFTDMNKKSTNSTNSPQC